ncbi:MAG: type VI secretion system baseplate subunit TssG [Bilophila wadsworthia]
MASAIRRASADLDGDALSRFRSAPWRFDVWQAGAILEAWKGRMDWASRLRTASLLGWSAAWPSRRRAPRLDVNLLGLAGMDGPLPPHVALLVRERMRAGDPAFQEFLDLFHNRILHLWRDMASSLCPELRADGLPEAHPFAAFLEAVSGLPNTGERARDVPMPGPVAGRGDVPAALFRSCAAVWARQPRSAAGLEKAGEGGLWG